MIADQVLFVMDGQGDVWKRVPDAPDAWVWLAKAGGRYLSLDEIGRAYGQVQALTLATDQRAVGSMLAELAERTEPTRWDLVRTAAECAARTMATGTWSADQFAERADHIHASMVAALLNGQGGDG